MITSQMCTRVALLATLVAASACGATDGTQSSSSPTSPSSAGLNRAADFGGVITSINAGGRTIVVTGTTVNVSAAAIHRGAQRLQLSDLRVAQRVRVRGAMGSAAVMASDVDVQEGDQSEGGEQGEHGGNHDHQDGDGENGNNQNGNNQNGNNQSGGNGNSGNRGA